MQLFEASVKIVRPGLSRVEEVKNSPSKQAVEDYESVAKVKEKLQELLTKIMSDDPRCEETPSINCCPEYSDKILVAIIKMLENYDYKVHEQIEYLDELIKKPDLITSLLKEPA